MPDQICPKCHAENRAGARFCGTCGAPLPPASEICPKCGGALRPGASFCGHCGAPVSSREETPPPPFPVYHTPPPPPQPQAPIYRQPQPQVPSQPRPAPQPATPTTRGSAPYLAAAIIGILTSVLTFCLVMGLVIASASDAVVPAVPAIDPNSANLTVRVAEEYLNDAVTQALPDGVPGKATVDVQPDQRLVVHATFPLLLLELKVNVRMHIAVVANQIRITVESVETGGHEILDLIGVDKLTLGENLSAALTTRLEEELGEASRVLDITTDDQYIILIAHLALP